MITSLKGASKNTLFNIATTVDPVLAFLLQTCIISTSHIGMHPSKMTPALGRAGGGNHTHQHACSSSNLAS